MGLASISYLLRGFTSQEKDEGIVRYLTSVPLVSSPMVSTFRPQTGHFRFYHAFSQVEVHDLVEVLTILWSWMWYFAQLLVIRVQDHFKR